MKMYVGKAYSREYYNMDLRPNAYSRRNAVKLFVDIFFNLSDEQKSKSNEFLKVILYPQGGTNGNLIML